MNEFSAGPVRVVVGLVLAVVLTAPLSAQAPPAASGASTGLDASALLADARSRLSRYRSISAKVRQQIDVFDVRQVGSGIYLQQTDVGQRMVRFELKVQVEGRLQTCLQVADGRYLWNDQQAGDQRDVSRVSLHRVASDFEGDTPDVLAYVGGLGELLTGLEYSFEFRTARLDQLTNLPVYVLTGVWRERELISMLPDQKEAIRAGQQIDLGQLPPQIPHEVEITLGRDDLFPYVIDYRRRETQPATDGGGSRPSYRSLVHMQLFEVRLGGPIDTRQFVYKPGEIQFTDRTETYIKQLRARLKRIEQ